MFVGVRVCACVGEMEKLSVCVGGRETDSWLRISRQTADISVYLKLSEMPADVRRA